MQDPKAQMPIPSTDVREHAAGYLSFLLSVIRSGEMLSAEEQETTSQLIRRLGLEAAQLPAQLKIQRKLDDGTIKTLTAMTVAAGSTTWVTVDAKALVDVAWS